MTAERGTRMGINVIINGQFYHFDNDERLIDMLDSEANRVGSTSRDNTVLYDDEMH